METLAGQRGLEGLADCCTAVRAFVRDQERSLTEQLPGMSWQMDRRWHGGVSSVYPEDNRDRFLRRWRGKSGSPGGKLRRAECQNNGGAIYLFLPSLALNPRRKTRSAPSGASSREGNQ